MKTPWPVGHYAAVFRPGMGTHQVITDTGDPLAIVGTTRNGSDPESRAAAILFAHAPELFACLDTLTKYHQIETLRDTGELVFECPCCGASGDGVNKVEQHEFNCDFRLAMLAVSRVRAITGEADGEFDLTDLAAHIGELPK